MTFNVILLALAVFFSLSACRPEAPTADARAPADGGAAAPVGVNPAAPAPAAPGLDGGSAALVMPEAEVNITPAPAAPAAPVDVKAEAETAANKLAAEKADKPAGIAPMAP